MTKALAVEYRPISELIPYARNSRTHSDVQVAQIAASMKEFGWTNPILIDDEGVLIAGHGRLLAAQMLKMDEVPTITIAGLSDAQKRALVIADNKLAMNAGWDIDLLKVELSDLEASGFDLDLTGFSFDELEKLLAPAAEEGLTDPDAIPEAPAFPVAEPGDVWLLGRHRLVCGDSTSADDVAKALNGVSPHLMVTDPPYGVNYDPSWRSKALKDGADRAEGKVKNDDRADWSEAWALFPGDVAYVWHAMKTSGVVYDSLIASGFNIRSEIVWVKNRLVLSQGDYHPKHESCWYAVKSTGKGHWAAGRDQTTVWEIEHQKSETGHGTQKPVEAMKRPIENNSSPGQAVYEPFSGSGTTIIACEMSGRTCHALELDPAYIDVAVTRWQEFTGQEAKLESDGRTFAEVLAARGGSLPVKKEKKGRGSAKQEA